MCPVRDKDPASGHPIAQKPPLARRQTFFWPADHMPSLPRPFCVGGVCIESPFPRLARVGVVGPKWRIMFGGHLLPFPWTVSFHRLWCPLVSHHPRCFLFLPSPIFPLCFLCHSLGRLCQCTPGVCIFEFFVSDPHRGRQVPSPLAR